MKRFFWIWSAVAVALLAYGFWQGMYVAPTEATMGPIQRIFYWHVPINIFAEISPYVNMFSSIAYLLYRGKDMHKAMIADALALASAEVTVLFVSLGLMSGILWGRPAWGIWWAWDARTTTYLLLWLLYVSYLLVRRYTSGVQAYTLAAVLSVFAGIDVPIVYKSISWWRTQHPAPVLTGDGYLDPDMKRAFAWNALAWIMWGTSLVWARYAIIRREQKIRDDAALEAMEA